MTSSALSPFRSRLFSSLRIGLRRPSAISTHLSPSRALTSSPLRHRNLYDPEPQRPSFYKSHGRAFFKCFTLAFFTYQVIYYCWLTLETEYIKDEREREIKSLEGEVRLLEEGRRSHRNEG